MNDIVQCGWKLLKLGYKQKEQEKEKTLLANKKHNTENKEVLVNAKILVLTMEWAATKGGEKDPSRSDIVVTWRAVVWEVSEF